MQIISSSVNWHRRHNFYWKGWILVLSVLKGSRAVFPLRKSSHWANVCFSAHAIAQPCTHTKSEALRALQRLCLIYAILNLECCKCARMRLHCANVVLVLLRVCAVALLRGNTDHGLNKQLFNPDWVVQL